VEYKLLREVARDTKRL